MSFEIFPCFRPNRLRNNTNRTLYLRQRNMHLTWTHETRLDPGVTIDKFPAATYLNKDRSARTESMIFIFVGECQSFGPGLCPLDFIRYIELIFEIDEGNNTLIVSGLKAQSTDYFPFRCISLVKTLKHLPFQQRPSYLWNYIKAKSDYSGRQREVLIVSGFEVVKPKHKGNLLPGQERMRIFIMINYDGERKKKEEGAAGFIWTSGAHAKWEAISVDVNNLTLDGLTDQICTALGLNRIETKLVFSHLPEISNILHGLKSIHGSRKVKSYLTLYRSRFHAIPQLHVKMVKTNNDQVCGK